jgi:hypothetical protein
VTPGQAQRLREMRARVLVRSFEYRQRRHARGVWYRLRRALALAKEAYAVSREEAEELVGEGYGPEPVGREIEPARTIVFVPAERAARIGSARPVPVRLGTDVLSAPALVLVRFPPSGPHAATGR